MKKAHYKFGSSRRKFVADLLEGLSAESSNCRFIHAPFGAGRADVSFWIGELAQREGRNFLQLNCLPADQSIAFAAVATFLKQAPDASDLLGLMRQVEAEISSRNVPGGLRTLLLIENVQYIDPQSAYILTQLVQLRRIDLILLGTGTSRETRTLTQFGALITDASMVLGPLSDEQISNGIQRVTGAVPTQGSVEIARSLTAGIYELVQLFLAEVQSKRLWRIIDGHSVVHGELVAGTRGLDEALGLIFERLRLSDRQALTQLAFAGECTTDFLEEHVSDAGRWAFEAGLLRLNSAGRIEMSSSLLESLLRRTTPPEQARLLLERWESQTEPSKPELTWQCAMWKLTAGYELRDSQLADAAKNANGVGNHPAAFALATARGVEDGTTNKKLQELYAIATSGQILEAIDELERAIDAFAPQSVGEAFSATWISVLPLTYGQQTAQRRLCRVIERYLKTHSDCRFLHDDSRVDFIKFLVDQGHEEAPDRDIRSFITQDNPLDVVFAAVAFGLENLTLSVSEPTVNYAISLISANGTADMKLHLQLTILMVQEANGDLFPELFEEVDRSRKNHRAIRVYAAINALANGWKSERRGDYGSCLSFLGQSTGDFLEARFVRQAQDVATALLSRNPRKEDATLTTLMTNAQYTYASGSPLSKALSSLQPIAEPFIDLGITRAKLTTIFENEMPETSIQSIWQLYRCYGAQIRDLVLELKTVILELSERIVSVRYSLIGSFLTNIDGHPEVLQEIAHEAESLGLFDICDTAWAEVLHIAPERGIGAAQARRYLYRNVRDFSLLPAITEVLRDRGLTSRELVITQCAAQGMSNKTIANNLNLSTRTIEGHLYRAFDKLGVAQRSELKALNLGQQSSEGA